jgi:predicted TIM-barrel fold metal-dependent hydrolase
MPSVDCHAHIVDPSFPFAAGPGYRPLASEFGTWHDYRATLDAHSMTHAVLVQPSGYGYDNSAMLDALARGGGRLRGIAVVPPDASERQLAALAESQVVGVRFNVLDHEPAVFAHPKMHRLIERLRDGDFIAEVHAAGFVLTEAVRALVTTGVRCIVDHCGRPELQHGRYEPAFDALLELGRAADTVYVKLSAPFRVSTEPEPHADLDPFVARLIDSFTPDRCMWGSDWPFLGMSPRPSYARVLAILERWLPDSRDRERVLWRTPARLFGFR